MIADYRKLAPYYRNGLLYVPEITLGALVSSGLDEMTAQRVADGLPLDDAESLARLAASIETLLPTIQAGTPLFNALTSAEVYFSLTGLPQS